MDAWDDTFEHLMRLMIDVAADVALLASWRLVDLGVDSLQMMTLMGELEEAYDITFDEAVSFERFETVGSVWHEVQEARASSECLLPDGTARRAADA